MPKKPSDRFVRWKRPVAYFAATAACALLSTSLSAQNTRADVAEIQTHLTYLGYNPAGIDGQIGGGTRSAIRQFQLKNGLSVTGLPNSRTQATLRQVVNARLAATFGRPIAGEYGTKASCRIPSARMRLNGLRVVHKPTWADTGFDYILFPTGTGRFKVQWDGSSRQTGLSVQYDRGRDVFRVPEMQMLALDRCQESDNAAATGTSNTTLFPTVPRVPETALGSVSDEINALRVKLEEAEALRAQIASKLDRRTGRFGETQAQVRSLEANLKASQDEADALRVNQRKNRRLVRDLRQRVADLEVERDNLLATNNQLIDQQALQNDQLANGLRAQNSALLQENQRLQALLQQVTGQRQQNNGALRFQTKDGRFQFSVQGR